MTNQLSAIDVSALSAVIGGSSRLHVKGELDGDLSGLGGIANLKVKGLGELDLDRNDYGECMHDMKGRPSAEVVGTCGMPGSPVAK